MRVNRPDSSPVQGSPNGNVSGASKADRAREAAKAKSSGKAEGASVAEGASAEISSRGKEMAQAKAVAASAPDAREDRIAELKRRIAAGTYKVDAEKVADRMVDDHLGMAGIG
jgi:negative regulator of flagellin synthesis FlgM